MKKKSGFLTFCFSLVPGAGQMYQKYMKRGLSIMILFFVFAAFAIMLSTPIFALPMVIIYIYSFFDTFNIRNKETEEEEPHDVYIWNELLGSSKFDTKLFKKNKALGVVFILAGIYLLCNNVLLNLANYYDLYFLEDIIRIISRYLPALIISILSIFIGMKMLTNKE